MAYNNHADEQNTHKVSSSSSRFPDQRQDKIAGLPQEKENKLLNLKMDTAFKFVFGKEEFMIDLLNELLQGEKVIQSITYNPTEQVPQYETEKKVVFDIHCTADTGEQFVVEMQYHMHDYFKERTLYYISRKIDNQLRYELDDKGRLKNICPKDYKLSTVYGVFIMDFHLDDQHPRPLRDVQLVDLKDDNKVFMEALRMLYVELPSLEKPEDCQTGLDYWIYVIKNFENMETIPFAEKKPIFKRLKDEARYYKMSQAERDQYDAEVKNYLVYEATISFAEKKAEERGFAKGEAQGEAQGMAQGLVKGEAKGRAEERLATARNLKKLGVSLDIISQATGLSIEEIEVL